MKHYIQRSCESTQTVPMLLMGNASLRACLELCKFKIAAFTTLSTATGFILTTADLSAEILAPVLGVFLLACGSGALNQYQDRSTDALMRRTESRPIPSGRIESKHALYLSALLLIAGLFTLALTGKAAIPGLGFFAVIWYNLIYSYFKRKTAFAAVPGALTGTIPPVIGWVAGGGSLMEHELLAVCFFFFMWQVPHFWLLLLSYDIDYKKALLPSFNKIFSHHQMIRITFTWMSAAVVSCLLIPLFGSSNSNIESIMLGTASAWLTFSVLNVFSQNDKGLLYAIAFRNINIYILLVMFVLNTGRLLSL